MTSPAGDLYIGLMSGTSLDGIDVALAEFGGDAELPDPARLVAFESYTYEASFRDRMRTNLEEGSPAGLCDPPPTRGARGSHREHQTDPRRRLERPG